MADQPSAVIASPLPGAPRVALFTQDGVLQRVGLCPAHRALVPPREPVSRHFADQLERYFRGALSRFEGPLMPPDTPFRGRVRDELMAISRGSVASYGELARRVGSAPRAVAGACRANPLPLVVPCHRVVAATGPGGYMGQTGGEALAFKQWLLRHEGIE